MNNTGKYVLIGVGVLALVGISVFAMASTKKMPPIEPNVQPQSTPSIVDVADRVIGTIKGNEVNAQQRIANRKLRTATRQAKLLKKGKIKIEDLQALQNIK